MTRGESGEVRQRETAPALLDLKPQSCVWLMLPESGGGAKRPDGVERERFMRTTGTTKIWSHGLV